MKNLFWKTIVIGLILLAIPMKHYGQQPKTIKVSEVNVSSLNTIEERTYLIHSIQDHGYLCQRNYDKPNTIDVYMSSDLWDDSENFDSLLTALYDSCVAFSYWDKSERGELYVQWRQDLDDEVNFALYESFTKGIATDNATCETAAPFCTDNGAYTFPAGVNSGSPCGSQTSASCSAPYKCSGTPGQSTNCLSTAPNPAFYYLKIANAGDLNIKIYSQPRNDIDFDCWGPFDNIENACSQLSCSNIVDCSYKGGVNDEFCHINNAQPGKYYILLLTNYSNTQCNIHFENIGTGTTDCGIMPPLVDNDGPFCVGDAIHLTAIAQTGATYHWTGPNNYNSNQQNPTINNCNMTHAGSYTCTITVGNQSNNASTEITVYPKPTANFTATSVCLGNTTQFTSTSTTNPANQPMTYQWNFGDNSSPSTLQNPTHQYATAGSFTATLTINSGGNCSSTKTQNVIVYANPVANAGQDTTVIYGASAPLYGSGGAGTYNYHWEPADKVVNPNAQNTTTHGLQEETTFTLTVTSLQGNCIDSDEMTVFIQGSSMTMAPDATPTAICQGSSAQLNAHAGGGSGNFTYSWTPTTGLSNPHIGNPTASPTTTTTYTCTATDGYTTLTGSATVTVNYPETSEETVYICPDGEITWHGQVYSDEDDYTFDTVTSQGCDKTITLHLRHYPSYDENTIEAAICHGESYNFFGTDITSSCHQFPHTLSTIHGCDSIIRLNLTVYPDNGLTVDSVTVCPEQLPYIFYGQPCYNETEITHTDHDIHGCDSLVKLVLNISQYALYSEEQYIAYDDTPSFTWPANGVTYTQEGTYIDTLPTQYCEGIFTLKLHFMEAPEPEIIHDTACDSYVWPVSGTSYSFDLPSGLPLNFSGQQITQSHFDDLTPWHYENSNTSLKREHRLHLMLYKTSDNEAPVLIDGDCDSYTWYFGHDGEHVTYYTNGVWIDTIPSKLSNYHCDSIVTLRIQNMLYSPSVYDSIFPTESTTLMSQHYDTAYVITNTEFFSFIYDFYVEEKGSSVWDGCLWEKSEWATDWDIIPYAPMGETVNKCCKVHVGRRYENPVELTCKIWNSCMADGDTIVRKLYLKSSFLDVDEYDNSEIKADVKIAPNPTNGKLQLNFENMRGRVNIKVYDMTGHLIDNFETTIITDNQHQEYNINRYSDGVYCFVITDNRRTLSRKVILIH